MVRQWYLLNGRLLQRIFGQITFDEQGLSWVLIHHFKLPHIWNKPSTALLIKTPGENIENFKDYYFYIDRDLHRTDKLAMRHIFDGPGYNDLYEKNYARLCLHLKKFAPTLNFKDGDNLVDICQTVYHFLTQKKGA
jgi:hypothetical protein